MKINGIIEPMYENPAPPRQILIAAHPGLPGASALAEEVACFLRAQGAQATPCYELSSEIQVNCVQKNHADLFIAIGGDGTMLRAGHLCADIDLPLLGINQGHFGFLTELEANNWQEYLLRLLSGDFWIERHMMLTVEHQRNEKSLGSRNVLNEVVVTRGQVIRPIHLKAVVDGYELAEYVADGLITATPTGSTAYALAAGGPIMPPELRNILIIPVAPHLSLDRGIILSEGACVTITVRTDHQAVFSIDGQTPVNLLSGDSVRIEASPDSASFVRFHDPGYFYRRLTVHMAQHPSSGS